MQPARYPAVFAGDGFALNRLPTFRIGPAPVDAPPPGGHPPILAPLGEPRLRPAEPAATRTGATTPTSTTSAPLEASTQSYWRKAERAEFEEHCGDSLQPCSSNGRCQAGVCSCFAGFSGPTCNIGKFPAQRTRRDQAEAERLTSDLSP